MARTQEHMICGLGKGATVSNASLLAGAGSSPVLCLGTPWLSLLGQNCSQPNKPGTGLLISGTWYSAARCSNASLGAVGGTLHGLGLPQCSMLQQPIEGLQHQQFVGDTGLSVGLHESQRGMMSAALCAGDTRALASPWQLLWSLAG